MQKLNKIKVAVSSDESTRKRIIRKITVECGLAINASDADKLIKPTVYEFDISTAYFIVCDLHNFRMSPNMNQQLYQMAARGMAVIVGVKKLPAEFEFISETYYQNYL